MRWLVTSLGVAGALLCLLLALGAHLQLVATRTLMSQGRPVEGAVTGTWAGGRRSSRHDFSYAYLAGNVRHVKDHRMIRYRDYVALDSGHAITVRYDPADPDRSITAPELADAESWGNRLFFPLIGLALLGWALKRMVRRAPDGP